MKAELHIGLSGFDSLKQSWNALVENSITNTPFQRLNYQRSWWTHLGPGSLYTVSVNKYNDELVGIGSFYLVDQTLFFNGHVEETDYLDLITTPEHAQPVWETVLECLDSNIMPDWNCIDLWNIPAHSPTREILPRLAQSRGFSFHTEINEVCPIISLPDTFEAYLTGLVKKQRHEVRRKIRRANEAGMMVWTIGPEDDLESAVNQFFDLLQKSSNDKSAWLNDDRTALFQEIAAVNQSEGSLQLMFAVIEDQLAATLFNFDYNGRVWVYNSGFDPDTFRHLSAGVVLTAKAIETAIENGRTSFDFLRGNETYKYRFGAIDTTIHRIILKKE